MGTTTTAAMGISTTETASRAATAMETGTAATVTKAMAATKETANRQRLVAQEADKAGLHRDGHRDVGASGRHGRRRAA